MKYYAAIPGIFLALGAVDNVWFNLAGVAMIAWTVYQIEHQEGSDPWR